MGRSLLLAGSVFLCACEQNSTWLDTTGQVRTREQAQMDYAACYKVAGFPSDPARDKSAFNATIVAVETCMSGHGWKLKGYST